MFVQNAAQLLPRRGRAGPAWNVHSIVIGCAQLSSHFANTGHVIRLATHRFTSWQAFRDVLKELGDLAGQRELVAENLQGQVTHSISLLSKTLRDDRKKCLGDGALLSQNLSAQIASLDRAKRQYEKAFREAEKAVDSFQKADADLNLSRADVSGVQGEGLLPGLTHPPVSVSVSQVEKHKLTMTIKCQQSDDAKTEYANQLQKTNRLRQSHFELALPEVVNRFQEIDERRTKGLKEFIKGTADSEASVAPIVARCLEGVAKASESINEKADSLTVIDRYKTGFLPPPDYVFEDLSKADSESSTYSSQNNLNSNHLTQKGTLGANKLKKRAGIFGIFSSNKVR